MIKNILYIAWGNLKRKKLASLFTILTISLGMTLVVLILGVYHSFTGNIGPYQQRDKCLFLTRMSFVLNEKPVDRYSKNSTVSFINNNLKELQTPALVGLYSDGENVTWDIGSQYKSKLVKYLETDVNFWKIFQFQFIAGRPYTEKEVSEKQLVCVVSRKVALYLFNKVDVIGEYFERGYRKYRIVGVIENVHPHFDVASDFYVPYSVGVWAEDYSHFDKQLNRDLYLYRGHFKGVVLAENKSDLPLIRKEFNRMVSTMNQLGKVEEFDRISTRLKSAVQLIPEQHSDDMDDSVFLVISALVLFILSIPIVILSNINFYSLRERLPEIGIKKAFGATRLKLFYQFLGENLLVTLLGCFIAIILAIPLFKFLSYLLYQTSEVVGFQFDYIFIGYLLLACLVFGFLTGVFPVVRISKLNPVEAIHSNDAQWSSSPRFKIRKRVLQVSTYIILYLILALSCSLLFTYYSTSVSPLGYETKNIIKLAIAEEAGTGLWEEQYNTNRFKGFKEKLMKVSGIEDVSYVLHQLPFYTEGRWTKTFLINNQEKEIPIVEADTSFFKILKMDVIKGERFNSQNSTAKFRPAVVTRLTEKNLFNNKAVGKTIELKEENQKIKIVGVVKKYRSNSFAKEFQGIFLCRNKASRCVLIKYNPATDLDELHGSINHAIENQLSANYHFNSSRTIEDSYAEFFNRTAPMFYGIVMVLCFLLLNAWLGYFTLTWYNVKSRKPEMGIRRAVGATKSRVRLKIITENMILMLLGSGIAIALLLHFKPIFFKGFYWQSFNSALIAAIGVAIVLTLVSTIIPAFVAGRIQAIEALAYE